MTRWADRLIVSIAALTAIVFVADAIVSIASGVYLNLGSGVWLALARDTYDGVFYRPLWNGSEYGGTRYFPMLFVATAGLMRSALRLALTGRASSAPDWAQAVRTAAGSTRAAKWLEVIVIRIRIVD